MTALKSLRRKVLAAIVNGDSSALAGEIKVVKGSPEDRLDIHRRNYQNLMAETLAHTYPLILRLLRGNGAERRFYRLASAYLAENPPVGPMLADYGEGFADFLEGESSGGVGLAPLARLEWQAAVLRRNPPEPCLKPKQLKGLSPHRLAGLRLNLHPSVSLFATADDLSALWRSRGEKRIKKAERAAGEGEGLHYSILGRDRNGVFLHRVDRSIWDLANAVKEGKTLGEAVAESGEAADDSFVCLSPFAGVIGESI